MKRQRGNRANGAQLVTEVVNEDVSRNLQKIYEGRSSPGLSEMPATTFSDFAPVHNLDVMVGVHEGTRFARFPIENAVN